MSDKMQSNAAPPSTSSISGRHYSVTSVEKTNAPDGGDEGSWYNYVVNDGNSTISGMRSGNKKQVTEYAEQYAKDLNERGSTHRSSHWSPKPSAKTAAKPAAK